MLYHKLLQILQASQTSDCFTPVLMLVRSGELSSALDALKLGAYDYVVQDQPCGPEEVQLRVERALAARTPTPSANIAATATASNILRFISPLLLPIRLLCLGHAGKSGKLCRC